MLRTIAWALGVVVAGATMAFGGEIGYIEDFALARDRAEALKKLIPGTEDYYYYHCLHYLNSQQFEKVEPLTKPWHERFGQTARLTEIQTRYAFLTYERDPDRSLNYLRNRLGLQFNHQKIVADGPPNLPTALDQKRIARSTLLAITLSRWTNVDNFEDSALDWLAAENLNWERRRGLLARLQRPDVPNLPRLVVDDLNSQHPQPFGSFGVHRQMTLAQLTELVSLKGDLLNQTAYVQTMLTKLQPGADEDWRRDPTKLRAYLDRQLAFVRKLDPVHNSLRAHVLHQRLVLDRSLGAYDRELFIEYLKLPRHQAYMSKRLLEAKSSHDYPADLNANYSEHTLLPIPGPDEPLVRSYLKHFFATAENFKEFEPYINDVYLRHLFAETKIELGIGDPESHASNLPPELFQQLKERIDIDFAFTNRMNFGADEPVKLDMFVKNVPTMLVKVFEVNTQNFYRTNQREVDTDVNLDGLVANGEKTYTYTEPPLRRMPRQFEFPQLTKPGVYVIDFIGSGRSSRVLVRKGRLRPLVAPSTAGHKITVVDDSDRPVKDAKIWLGGQEYKAEADGVILVPFSTSPGRKPIVISRGEFACLDYIQHQPEHYHLTAGFHVEREALLSQQIATLLIRPGLYLNGQPVSIKLLEEVRLRITASDRDGISTATEVPDFKLFEDRDTTHEFRVPARIASLNVTMMAKVKSLSQNKQIDVSAADNFGLNGVAKTDKIEDLHFAKFGPDYMIELLGRSGEYKADRPVQLSIKHRDFKEPVNVTLKTDPRGRVNLGPLQEITSVSATGPEGTAHNWALSTDRHSYRSLVHARSGDSVTLPYVGSANAANRAELALFEMRGGIIQADRFENLVVRDGMIEANNLAAGDYDLYLKRTGERIRIRVVDGPVRDGYVLGRIRHMELPGLKPVHISAIESDAENVTIRLRDASKFARVHVFATRYQPAYAAYYNLSRVRDAELTGNYPAHAETAYLTGRNIGDEFRYVLDRRMQRKFPGNMLERPALLLNPWVLRSTLTGEQVAHGGDDFAPKGEPAPSSPAAPPPGASEGAGSGRGPEGDFADLDFLADSAAVLTNLVPDKDGVIKVKRSDLGAHAMIHVVATDPLSTTSRSTTLTEKPASFLDLRLRNGLDPKAHFTQQKQVSVLETGKQFVLADAAGGRFEIYDSLPKVYALYATLSKDPKLAEFSFILTWPTLKPAEKQTLYSKFACHELNFFLLKKDPEFFRAVVKPYLAHKKDKTFLDHWLLEDDLSDYLQPWAYGRLNSVERVLLAQRIAGEVSKTTRHLDDLKRMLPPNPDQLLMLFETAVKSSSLAADDATGQAKYRQELKKNLERIPGDAKPAEMPAQGNMPGGPVPAKPAPGAGFGGGKAGEESSRREAKGAKDQLEKLDKAKEGDKEERYYQEDRKQRKLPAQLYRKVDPTLEYAENNYYNLPIAAQVAALVGVSDFWLDYSKHDSKSPFLSKHLAGASRNFTEMMFALSVLDLPFKPGKHMVKFEGGKMNFTPAGTLVAFHEEVRSAADAQGNLQILVSENFYRNGDRFREENGERFDKFITAEFVIHTVYGGHIVVTNPTPSRQKLAVLVQVPVGAIPVANGQPTKTVLVDLEPYRTHTIDYFFYFPRPGQFAHFPAHVAKAEAFVASAKAMTFNVVEKPTKIDTESWAYVSQHGSEEQVLAFMNRENVQALNLDLIAFRMKDKAFFASVMRLLRDRHMFQSTLWSYGVFHNDTTEAREFLAHNDQMVNECGGPLTTPIMLVDPVARHHYEHLEYKPLVNARAHSLGQRRQIVNDRFHEQYHRYLKTLSYRSQLNDDDLLAVTYYMLLQDRVEDATNTFARVNQDRVATKMQYDYCSAYLELYGDEPMRARAVTIKYTGHPVDRWRNAFAAMSSVLDEIEGKGGKVADVENRNERQGELAATEAGVEFTLDAKTINLTWQNLDAAQVNYYLMDVELLFSRNPFVQQSGGQFSTIRPNFTQEIKLPAGQNKLGLKLPENLLKRNVLVEISAGGKTRSQPYYANAMDVKVTENYGQLRVTDTATGKALPKVYVKTYAKLADGSVKFYKDGYTDHRGRFDYASVSTPERGSVQRFAILVLSDEHGALIREATPPQQ